MGTSASVSLVTEEDDEYEDDVYVNVARAGGEEDEGWMARLGRFMARDGSRGK
jgi:hypothetical protein